MRHFLIEPPSGVTEDCQDADEFQAETHPSQGLTVSVGILPLFVIPDELVVVFF